MFARNSSYIPRSSSLSARTNTIVPRARTTSSLLTEETDMCRFKTSVLVARCCRAPTLLAASATSEKAIATSSIHDSKFLSRYPYSQHAVSLSFLNISHCARKSLHSSQCAMSGHHLNRRDEARPKSSTSIPCQLLLRLYFPFEHSVCPMR